MVIAELRQIDWYEEGRLEEYSPDPEKPFSFEVNLSIGERGGRGADLFRIIVCNPLALAQKAHDVAMFFGYERIVMREFEYEAFRNAIARWCEQCSAETWDELARSIGRIGGWEFECESISGLDLRPPKSFPNHQAPRVEERH
jgi:hypothetical protein